MILWYSLDPSKIGFDKASKICEMRIFSEDLVPQNKQDWAWGLLGMMNIPPYLTLLTFTGHVVSRTGHERSITPLPNVDMRAYKL